jgi:hypothetical protein
MPSRATVCSHCGRGQQGLEITAILVAVAFGVSIWVYKGREPALMARDVTPPIAARTDAVARTTESAAAPCPSASRRSQPTHAADPAPASRVVRIDRSTRSLATQSTTTSKRTAAERVVAAPAARTRSKSGCSVQEASRERRDDSSAEPTTSRVEERGVSESADRRETSSFVSGVGEE